MEKRRISNDAQSMKIEPLCSGKSSDRGQTATDNRMFIEAVLWIVRNRHGQGAKGDSKSGRRQIQRRMTTKILAMTDALGNLIDFKLMPAVATTSFGIGSLARCLEDKAFDAD